MSRSNVNLPTYGLEAVNRLLDAIRDNLDDLPAEVRDAWLNLQAVGEEIKEDVRITEGPT